MAAAVGLESIGFEVELYEARRHLGGRASSFPIEKGSALIDNCPHVVLGCCRNLLDFYQRLGVLNRIRFYEQIYFVEPGGRVSTLRGGRGGRLASLLRLRFLGLNDKLALMRALVTVRREYRQRGDLDSITMLDWLRQHRQGKTVTQAFWRPLLISALNEEPDRTAARYGLQVLWLALLASPDGGRMGVPAVTLAELYPEVRWRGPGRIALRLGERVEKIVFARDRVEAVIAGGCLRQADYYVLAVPWYVAAALAPPLHLEVGRFEASPITAIHLWLDRPVTRLPQAALLGRNLQWVFTRDEGRYLLCVVSASRGLIALPHERIVRLALAELAEFFPAAREANVEGHKVVTVTRATFSPKPSVEAARPAARTRIRNLFLAGDWTRSGWPATMEGAVRSGYLAAEAVAAAAGRSARLLIPDPAP